MTKEVTYIKSELHTRASSDLNIEDDLLVPDPEEKNAKAAIQENIVDKIVKED